MVPSHRGRRPVGSADAAGEGFEAGLGDQGVDEAEDERQVFLAEFADLGQACAEGFVAAAERPPGRVVDE